MPSKSQTPTAAQLDIVWLPPSDLVPYPKNTKTHPPEQVESIARQIKEHGFDQPIVLDGKSKSGREIIKGHGRREAALLLKMDLVPCVVHTKLSRDQVKAMRIADNKVAESPWDLGALRLEMGELRMTGFDVSLTGFGQDEVAKLFGSGEGKDPNAPVPPPPEKPVTRAGDIWLLDDRHRIICGDSTAKEVVSQLLEDVPAQPSLMVTDPPYGVSYDPTWRTTAGINKAHQKVATGKVMNDDRSDWREAWALFPGDVAYVWHGALHSGSVEASLAAADFEMRAQIIWGKASMVMGRGHYHWQHEPCWYAVRKGRKGSWAGDRKQTTLWSIPNMHISQGKVDDGKTIHGTQKPVECMKRPIENNSKLGDGVYEPFSGSGTTIIAAEMTGRRCYAIELNPAYVDVAVERWQAFTGKLAVLAGDGRSYADVKSERL